MKINLNTAVEENFARYAGNVILDRAICDSRDMLKPSARMLMYSQRKITKNTSDKAFVKSARVVGDALGRFYTHGDSSCYGTYMRMAKPFAMRYPLEDCQGNSGTIITSGDEAAMRYTELRPSKVSDYLFNGIEKNAISEWKDNFDETLQYPGVLPSIGFYNIVNGTTGIGVSISSSVPQFNLREVNEAIVKLIENPEASFENIYCAPDFATGGTILNAAEVRESLRNGYGKAARIRAKINYDSKSNSLIVTELPYGVYSGTITEEIEQLLNENENYGIESINDGSGSTVNYTIVLSKDANPSVMMRKLYADTSLESYFTINMVMLENGRFPKVFSWKEALQSYIAHMNECKRRELKFDMDALINRNHILDGLKIALANIDDVVALIRNSENAAKAKIGLMERYGLDDEQAKAILDMKLQRLANLEAIKVNKEFDENAVEIDRLGNILGSQDEVNKLLIAALREVATKFGDARRTQLMNLSEQVQEIEEEEVILNVSGNTIKVVKRGVKDCFKTTNLSTLLFVTNQGKMYHVPVSNVIEVGSAKIGTLIKDNAPIVYYGDLEQIKLNKFWMFATSDGMIKKSNVEEYNYYGRNGTKMLKLREKDTVIACGVFTSNCETFTIPRGNSHTDVSVGIVNPTGKAAMGSKVFKE